MDAMDKAVQEMFESHRRASARITLWCFGLFLLGVALVVLAGKAGLI